MARGKPLSGGYARLAAKLDQTTFDPEAWSKVCDELASLVDAAGGLIIPQQVCVRGLDLPHSASLSELLERYIASGWHKKDFRSQGFPIALERGFVTDRDLIAPSEMERHPYYSELIYPAGMGWFVGIAFDVQGKTWGVSVNAAAERDPFEPGEIRRLFAARDGLSMAASRAAVLGGARIETLEHVFAAATRGVVILDWAGKIRSVSDKADELLKGVSIVSGGRLASQDAMIERRLAALVERIVRPRGDTVLTPTKPIVMSSAHGRTVAIDGFPMPRDFQALLSGACAIVTIQEMPGAEKIGGGELGELFELTAREAELADGLAAGRSLAEIAAAMGISIATARHYLKSVFAKTGTGRQAELVALLARHTL